MREGKKKSILLTQNGLWAILDLNPPKIAEPLKNGLRERAILGSTLVLAPEQAMPVRLYINKKTPRKNGVF